MAERRMFRKSLLSGDDFLDMEQGAQLLYIHMGMHADDDGFVNNPKMLCRVIGVSTKEIESLINKDFLIAFESGVVAIRHWKMNNQIRKDTYTATIFKEERALLDIDKNGMYILRSKEEIQRGEASDESSLQGEQRLSDGSLQGGEILSETPLQQYSIDKDSIVKDSIVKDSAVECIEGEECKGEEGMTAKTAVTVLPCAPSGRASPRHKYGEYENVLLSESELEKLKSEFPDDWEQRIERLSEYIASSGKRYKSHLATIRSWSKNGKDITEAVKKKSDYDIFMEQLKVLREEES